MDDVRSIWLHSGCRFKGWSERQGGLSAAGSHSIGPELQGEYTAAQREAEHNGRGMWSGGYVLPWLYRPCITQGGTPAGSSDDANARH